MSKITTEVILDDIKKKYTNKQEYNKIINCYQFAKNKYQDQMINVQESEIDHALEVIKILLDLNVDYITICATFFHEIINDTDVVVDDIKLEFGEEIAKITESINVINNLSLNDNDESSAIYLRKVLVGLASDVRVIIIKLADRLHNMRSIWSLDQIIRTQKVNETEKVLIPIAHRLGINGIKSELEDLCLLYKNPHAYQEIEEKLAISRSDLNQLVEKMKKNISDILNEYGIKHEIKGRVKSVHSIYDKLAKGRKWEDIYDILALRVFVDSETDCYTAVGLIHSKYRPVPKRFKDFIAMPKENMYQSLHTTVFGIDGHFFEVQIRTYEMDEIAEKGIASHWSYKEHGSIKAQNMMEQKLELFRNLIESTETDYDKTIFDYAVKNEILAENIYVFTPKGDVVELPSGSTPIDFAYRIHSRVGETMVGAIVNDEIVPLNYVLKDNDIVKINTNNSSTPSKDWLNIVKTSQAKNKIKAYFNQIIKEEYILKGHEILEKDLKKQHLNYNEIMTTDNINKIISTLKLSDAEELFINIGSLRYTPTYILSIINDNKIASYDILLNKIRNTNREFKTEYSSNICVEGIDNIRVNLAKCCNPVKGDPIIGYITMGQGVTVHRKDCKNIVDNERIINVTWNDTNKEYLANIDIKTDIGKNYLLDIVTVVTSLNLFINNVTSKEYDTYNLYNVTIKLKDLKELEHLIIALENKPFIKEVKRGIK